MHVLIYILTYCSFFFPFCFYSYSSFHSVYNNTAQCNKDYSSVGPKLIFARYTPVNIPTLNHENIIILYPKVSMLINKQ